MGIRLLLRTVLLNKLLRCLECIFILLPLALHGKFIPNLTINRLLILLPLAHDISQHILLPKNDGNAY